MSEAGPAGRPGPEPEPEPEPEIVAVLMACVDQAWPRPVVFPDERDPAHSVWRFSGRWWNKPAPIRRDRPWVSG